MRKIYRAFKICIFIHSNTYSSPGFLQVNLYFPHFCLSEFDWILKLMGLSYNIMQTDFRSTLFDLSEKQRAREQNKMFYHSVIEHLV